MSRQRRNFSAKFKSDLVIELLKGEKDLNTLATENDIQPNLLRNWKKEFLGNAFAICGLMHIRIWKVFAIIYPILIYLYRQMDGTYMLSNCKSVPAFNAGKKNEPNKWITFYAYMAHGDL